MRKSNTGPISKIFLITIRFYQLCISPWTRSCRFYPSCSSYAAEAVQKHGAGRGSLLTIWRLCRCHPFSRGGYDPVPESTSNLQPEELS